MIILGLGSNVGDRLGNLESAILKLSSAVLKIKDISSIYESPALLKDGAPPEWNSKFLNMAVSGKTDLSPRQLLGEIKSIEKQVGRQARGVWAPREIDIDILLFGDATINEPDLVVPHPAMAERSFVMMPLSDIAPDLFFVESNKTAREIASSFNDSSIYRTGYKISLPD